MNLAWLDLETTGSSLDDGHQILEVGCIVTTMALEAVELGTFHRVVAPSWPLPPIDRVVMEMHLTSGLWADVVGPALPVGKVDEAFARFLDDWTDGGKIALAGSGVGHFDRRFMDRWMPESVERLTYWPIDVGAVRRFATKVVGLDNPLDNTSDKPHRSMEDAALHLDEARAWAAALARLRTLTGEDQT